VPLCLNYLKLLDNYRTRRYNVRVTIARHIGQYRILRKIGAGGMGLVFLGEHTLLGRRAAIKTLLPTMSANREIVERFFNEARATSAISDPGVIQVFDFGYHVDGTAYIVMELLEGEALSARIDRLGKLPPGDALRIARQIAGSLAAAHACDIVHRDLKPENIFLVADAEAQGGERTKILDFGICKMGTGDPALTQSGAMIGTPVYMSPEQCRGSGGVDHRSDIYAFGCLLFHMLTGRPPFLGDASGELIVAHLEEEAPAPSLYVADLPFAVDALVLRCLAKAPEHRYQSMTDLQGELGDLSAGLESSEPMVAAVPPSMPLGRGFRSLYDGNFASKLVKGPGESSGATRRPPWLRYVPTPRTTAPVPEDDPGDSVAMPARRATIRAVLACVLVVGVVIGLVTTSFVIYGPDHAAEASARAVPRAIAQPAAAAAAADDRQELARPAEPEVAAMPAEVVVPSSDESADAAAAVSAPDDPAADAVADDAARRASRVSSSSAPSVERSRRLRDAPRELNTAAKPRPRPTGENTRPTAAPPSLPIAPATPARTPATVAPPALAPAPPGGTADAAAATPSKAPTSPTEDLYDTR
jgi:serine/threonine-protein kinase